MKINSHNEWDKLREIIVGSASKISATLEWLSPEPIHEQTKEEAFRLAKSAYPQWLVDEIMEDLDGLANTLKGFGVKVHRPDVHDIAKTYSSPYWTSTGNNLYNVRDMLIGPQTSYQVK